MNRKRLQMLRDMIAGIPAKRINLGEVFKDDVCGDGPAPKPCGAVACMAGWAWIYPPFVRAGIRKISKSPCDAADVFFGTQKDNPCLFDSAWYSESGTHKQIALRRLDALLKG